ncbi:hypothetical protein B0H10DRAFT_2070301, partial [Mycena sp. CBHHK59/15]
TQKTRTRTQLQPRMQKIRIQRQLQPRTQMMRIRRRPLKPKTQTTPTAHWPKTTWQRREVPSRR